MWGGAGAGRGREVLGAACGRGGGALSTQPNRCRCVHWPSGLTDSSLMEASVCRSGAVWGWWGAGLGASGSVGQRWWSIESIRAFPIGWVDVFVITPTLPVCVGGGAGVVRCVGRRGLWGAGGAKRRRHVLDSARALAVEVGRWRRSFGDGGGRRASRSLLGWRAPETRGAPG